MKYSLIIGRFQPLHKGHIKLIRTVLNEGKNVLIALKKTGFNKRNPYSYDDRLDMFIKEFIKEIINNTMKIIPIDNVDEVVYGRKVGWGIRQIKLDKKTEAISASKIRQKNINRIYK